MLRLRRLILDRAGRSAALLALALAMRLLVPAGFMPMATAGGVTITLCGGLAAPAMAMAGMVHHRDAPDDTGRAKDAPCAFVALALSALSGGEPTLAASPATVEAATARPPAASTATASVRLRPPTRAPPAAA